MKILLCITFAVLGLGGKAFAANNSEQDDAIKFCEAFTQAIEQADDSSSIQQIFAVAAEEINKNVNTSKIRDLISAKEIRSFEEYYGYLQNQLTELSGKEWNCVALKDALVARASVLVISALSTKDITPNSKGVIIVSVNDQGQIFVNQAPLKDQSKETLHKAVQLFAGEVPISNLSLYLHVDGAIESNTLVGVLKSLEELAPREIGLIQ